MIDKAEISPEEPLWIVNDIGELGVKIGNKFYFLYKGNNLEYESGLHEDGTPMMYRPVGKREFGEVCHPIAWYEQTWRSQKRYTKELIYTPGLSDGQPNDPFYQWKPIGEHE